MPREIQKMALAVVIFSEGFGTMVYSLLLFGLVIYLWENETFAIAANSNGLRGALWARAIKNVKKPPGEKG